MPMAWSALFRRRLWRSCRNASRPMVSPSAAVSGERALISDANLGCSAGAAQEFRLVDDRHAERLRPVELGAGVGPRDQGSGVLRDAVRHMPPAASITSAALARDRD